MAKKRSVKILIIVILLWAVLFATDYIRANMDKSPIFAYPVIIYQDGGSKECFGIGYKVNVYVSSDIEHFGEIIRVDIGTWSTPFVK